ncbi:MAG: MoaD/ThiS family protein [Gemmatimonadetes bacterium]|jgi:molybdopterin converting factor small subunit|nr:MoaD/ThiS family protein [Gemmatimonadota bacterium]
MDSVNIEIMPWLSRYFAAGRSGRVVMERKVDDGTTIRDLLEEIIADKREVREILFEADTGRLFGYIALVLNERFVELSGGLDTELKSGDTLRLMPGFSGG